MRHPRTTTVSPFPMKFFALAALMLLGHTTLWGQMTPLVGHYEQPSCLEWNESGRTAQLDTNNCKADLKEELWNVVKYIYDTSFVLITDRDQPRIVKEDEIYYVKSFFYQDNGYNQKNPPHIGLMVDENFEIKVDKRGIEGYMKHLISISELGDFTKICRRLQPDTAVQVIKKGNSHVLYKSTDRDSVKRWYVPYEGRVSLLEEISVFRQGLVKKKTIRKQFVFNIRVFETRDTFGTFNGPQDRYRYYYYLDDIEYEEVKNLKLDEFVCPPDLPSDACLETTQLYSSKDPAEDYLTICKSVEEDSVVIFRKEDPFITFFGKGDTLRSTKDSLRLHTLVRVSEDTAYYVEEDMFYVEKPNVEACCKKVPLWTYLVPGSGFEFFRQRKKRQEFGFNPCNFDQSQDRKKVKGFPLWPVITAAWATGLTLTAIEHEKANKYFVRHQSGTELLKRRNNYQSYMHHHKWRKRYGAATLLLWVLNDGYFLLRSGKNYRDCTERFGEENAYNSKLLHPRNFRPAFVQLDNGASGFGFSYRLKF